MKPYTFRWRHLHLILVALFIAHLIFIFVLLMRQHSLLQEHELHAYDLLFPALPSAPSLTPPITLIWLDDEDQRLFSWPLPDAELLQLLKNLKAFAPAVIGLDIYRDAPVPRNNPFYDELIDFLQQNNDIILIKKFYNEAGSGYVRALPELSERQVAFNDLPTDPGNIIRRGLLYLGDEQGNILESFSMKLARYYLFKQGIHVGADPDQPGHLQLGQHSLAPLPPNFGGYLNGDMAGFQLMLTYPGAPNGFISVNLRTVLNGIIDPTLFENRIVIIGVKAEATPDFLFTPYSRLLTGDDRVPGGEIHAYIVQQLVAMAVVNHPPLRSWSETQAIFWLWFWCLLGTFICLLARNLWQLAFLIIFASGLLIAFSYLSMQQGLWIPFVSPSLGWIFAIIAMTVYLSHREKTHRATLMQLFSSHVSRAVANVIWQEREQFLHNGRLLSQRLTATVLFSDLQNFTTIAEKMEPEALMTWLNHYMTAMVNIVEQHQGQVNKFIGDAIMAVFGIPVPRTSTAEIQQDAIHAVACALQMRTALDQLHQEWQAQGLPPVRIRIGIFTGSVVAGSLGGVERQEYTVIGDTVNTASRLESFDKSIDQDSQCRILIGDSTADYLADRFILESVGSVQLKGKSRDVIVYRVVGWR